jgi:hypothetical protein
MKIKLFTFLLGLSVLGLSQVAFASQYVNCPSYQSYKQVGGYWTSYMANGWKLLTEKKPSSLKYVFLSNDSLWCFYGPLATMDTAAQHVFVGTGHSCRYVTQTRGKKDQGKCVPSSDGNKTACQMKCS